MIFYGTGGVWDARKNGRLCRFVDGKAEITDQNDIAYMIRLGYKHEAIQYNDAFGDAVKIDQPKNEQPVSIEPNETETPQPARRGRKPKGIE